MADLATDVAETVTQASASARHDFTTVPLDRIRLHPLNLRRQLRDLEELADSIRQHGLLEPVILVPDPEPPQDDEQAFVLVAGHRRHAACVMASHDPVEAIIRQDLQGDGAQVLTMLTENGPRDDLTPIEEAHGYQLALDLNRLTPAKLAKRLGKPRSHINGRIGLTKLPEEIQERVHAHQISLTEAEAMADFGDDTGAIDRLHKAAGTGNFDWKLREEQQRRAKAKKRAALLAELEKAGAKIIDKPQDDYASTAKPIGWLYDDEQTKQKIDEEVHQSTCPHAAVAIIDAWDGPQVISYCTDPKTAGHHLPSWAATSHFGGNGKRPKTADEIRWQQERHEQEQKHAIARTLRAEFLTALDLKPKASQLAILQMLARLWIPPFLKESRVFADRSLPGITVADVEHLGAAFGVTIPKHHYQGRPGTKAQEARDLEAARNSWPLFEAAVAKATIAQLLHGLVSLARLELEANARHTHGDRYDKAQSYLATLDALGYQPSDDELELRKQLERHSTDDAEEQDQDGPEPAAAAPDGSCPVCGELVEAADGETYRCPNGHESAIEDLEGTGEEPEAAD